MIEILGKRYSSEALAEFFGDSSCIAGMRRYQLREGRSCGVDLTQIRTGSGLEFEVNETRGLDIGRCLYKGFPVSYMAYGGECHPAFYEPFNDGWLRAFGGGLLVMGGLRSTGAPGVDRGEIFPLHGRISNIPAANVTTREMRGEKGCPLYIVEGEVRESKALNHNLVLRRKITARQGTNTILIDDQIKNEGFEDEEIMLLYHFNFGHPIIDGGSHFLVHSRKVIPRDEDAAGQEEPYDAYVKPTPHYKDIVYYHVPEAHKDGRATAAIVNERAKIGVYLRFSPTQLPCLTQWKFLGQGNYVAGIEPGNAYVDGRVKEREERGLEILPARKTKQVSIEFGFLASEDEIRAFKEENDFGHQTTMN